MRLIDGVSRSMIDVMPRVRRQEPPEHRVVHGREHDHHRHDPRDEDAVARAERGEQ